MNRVRLEFTIREISESFPVPDGLTVTPRDAELASGAVAEQASKLLDRHFPEFGRLVRLLTRLEVERMFGNLRAKNSGRTPGAQIDIRAFSKSINEYLSDLQQADLSVYELVKRLNSTVIELASIVDYVHNLVKPAAEFAPDEERNKEVEELREELSRLVEAAMKDLSR